MQPLVDGLTSDGDWLTAVACQPLRDLIGGFRFQVEIIIIRPADADALWSVVRALDPPDADFYGAPAPGLRIEWSDSLRARDMSLPASDRGNQQLEEPLRRFARVLVLHLCLGGRIQSV